MVIIAKNSTERDALFNPNRYMIAVAMLEILVYLGEFLVYRKRMGDVSLNRCIAYTLCANTASLMAGLLIPILSVLPTLII